MFSEIRPNRGSQKYAIYFTWQEENKLFKASVLWMNESRIQQDMKIVRNDSAVKPGCSDWCGLPLNASERLSEQALIFHTKGSRFSSLGYLHCDDRRSPWWASRDRLQHDCSRSDTVMFSMNFNSYARLYFSSFLFFSVLFLNTKLYILYKYWLCLIFTYVNLQSNWALKPLKLGLSILFYLWGFLSLLTLQ